MTLQGSRRFIGLVKLNMYQIRFVDNRRDFGIWCFEITPPSESVQFNLEKQKSLLLRFETKFFFLVSFVFLLFFLLVFWLVRKHPLPPPFIRTLDKGDSLPPPLRAPDISCLAIMPHSWKRMHWKENDRQRNLCVFRGGFKAVNCLVCVRMKGKKKQLVATCYQTSRSDSSLISLDFSSTSSGGAGSARGGGALIIACLRASHRSCTLSSCESIDWKVLKVYPFSGPYLSSWTPNLKKKEKKELKKK